MWSGRDDIALGSRIYREAQARARIDRFSKYVHADNLRSAPGLCIEIRGKIGKDQMANAARIERKLKLYNERQIEVIIDSPGGHLQEAQKIYSLLRGCGSHITTRAVGTCASAATIILLAGDWREATATSRFLLHEGEIDPNQARAVVGKDRWTADFHLRISKIMNEQNAKLAHFYAGRTGKPVRMFQEAMRAERVLNANEAREISLINNVLNPTG